MDKKDSEYMRENHRKIVKGTSDPFRGALEETAQTGQMIFWFALGMIFAVFLINVLDWLASRVPQTY